MARPLSLGGIHPLTAQQIRIDDLVTGCYKAVWPFHQFDAFLGIIKRRLSHCFFSVHKHHIHFLNQEKSPWLVINDMT